MSNVAIEAPDPTTARDFLQFSFRRFDTVGSRTTSRSVQQALSTDLAGNDRAHPLPRCEPSPIKLQGVIDSSRREYRHQPAAGPLTGRDRSEPEGPGEGFRLGAPLHWGAKGMSLLPRVGGQTRRRRDPDPAERRPAKRRVETEPRIVERDPAEPTRGVERQGYPADGTLASARSMTSAAATTVQSRETTTAFD